MERANSVGLTIIVSLALCGQILAAQGRGASAPTVQPTSFAGEVTFGDGTKKSFANITGLEKGKVGLADTYLPAPGKLIFSDALGGKATIVDLSKAAAIAIGKRPVNPRDDATVTVTWRTGGTETFTASFLAFEVGWAGSSLVERYTEYDTGVDAKFLGATIAIRR